MKQANAAQILATAVHTLLCPLVRILLRNGVSFKAFSEMAKQAYVEVAQKDFALPARKQTTSRLSILTGLTRKEVQQILSRPSGTKARGGESYGRAVRVISGWVRDIEFWDKDGNPSPLPIEGARVSFTELVKRYSGDMPVRAMLDELVRVGSAETLKDGRVRLVSRGYVPQRGKADQLQILGADTADLLETLDHNIYHPEQRPRLQRKVMYDNVPAEAAEAFRAMAMKKGQDLLESLDSWLAQHDRDVNPSVDGTGRVRVGLGMYQFEDRPQSDEAKPEKE
jgi:hypothetical protein